MTEELTSGGGATLSVGQAVQRVKQRYFLEDSGCFDAYDQKSLMQWTLFGLPMYGLRIGNTGAENAAEGVESLRNGPLRLADLPTEEHFGDVIVRRSLPDANETAALPSFLTRVEHSFGFSAAGVYVKRDTSGNVPSDLPGCPDEKGCYYELNGLATSQADLPVEPYFIYESRLLGTSQHGVLWKGGTFQEEDGWRALRAVLQSNNTDEFDDLGPIGRDLLGCPIGTSLIPGGDPTGGCPATDLELNKLVVPTGELLVGDDGELSRHRRQLNVDLEVFYFNDTQNPTNNCDRTGHDLEDGPFEGVHHRVEGTLVTWQVEPTDPEGVWRVLVVLNDGTLDAEGQWQLAATGAGARRQRHLERELRRRTGRPSELHDSSRRHAGQRQLAALRSGSGRSGGLQRHSHRHAGGGRAGNCGAGSGSGNQSCRLGRSGVGRRPAHLHRHGKQPRPFGSRRRRRHQSIGRRGGVGFDFWLCRRSGVCPPVPWGGSKPTNRSISP